MVNPASLALPRQFLMTIQNVQPLDQTLFASARLITESGPIEGRNQMVLWENCRTAQWKRKGGSRWELVDNEGQAKLEPGYLLYFYEGTIKERIINSFRLEGGRHGKSSVQRRRSK
jgi:hypothetical protein